MTRRHLLIWQCTPSKPVWHLQMYSLKTSPRLVGETTSHTPSFLQGLAVQGPDGRRAFLQDFSLKKSAAFRTCLGQVAGIATKAFRTNTDEGVLSDSCHACSSIVAMFYLTVVTCESAGRKIIKQKLRTRLEDTFFCSGGLFIHNKTGNRKMVHIKGRF